MPSVAKRTGRFTFHDFLALVSERQKADLLDGVIYMASPESTDHNQLALWICKLMSEFAEQLNLGEVFFTRVAFRLSEGRSPEPDVALVARSRIGLVKKGYVDGPPDLAVEIVSADSVERDYVTKRSIYEKAGVREYWIIDPDQRQATFLRRFRGKFREIEPEDGVFQSAALPGFRLDVKWLWARRRPSAYRVLRELLDALDKDH